MNHHMYLSILYLVSALLFSSTNAIKLWCKQHFEGFDVEDDYNPNLPPTQNVKVEDFHVLNQLEEVTIKLTFSCLIEYLFRKIILIYFHSLIILFVIG